MEAHPPPLYVVIPGRVYRPDSDATHTPQFHQIEGLAVDEDITLADLKGTLLAFARAIFGERARGAAAPALLPLHRAERRGRRVLLPLRRPGLPARRLALPAVQGRGLARGARRRRGRPERLRLRAHDRANAPGYDPEKVQGFAWGMGVERIAMLKHGIPDLRLYYENDLRFLEQFGCRVSRCHWLREYCDPALDVRRDRGAPDDDRHEGRGDPPPRRAVDRALRRRAVLDGRAAPRRRPAAGLPGRPRRGHGPATIVCGAPNVAAGQTVAVARPGRGDARRHEARSRPSCAAWSREGMILAENELELGPGDEGIMVLDGRLPSASCPARRSARCCRSPPRCSSSRSRPTGPTASASTASRASCTPRPARRSPPRRGARTPARPAR